MAYLQARYGIAFPMSPEMTSTIAPSAEGPAGAVTAREDELAGAALPWPDPEHPDIDYSIAPFELAHNEGYRISGWWVIQEERSVIDDSPRVLAVN